MSTRLRLFKLALTTTAVTALSAASASAAVQVNYNAETQHIEIVGDNGADTVAPTCANNKVMVGAINTQTACSIVRGFEIDLKDGTNSADLTGVTAQAFTNLGDQQSYTGGSGQDTFTGATSAKFPEIGADDIVKTGGGNDTVIANMGEDYVVGGAGTNDIDGGTENDTVGESTGGAGAVWSNGKLFFASDQDDVSNVETISVTGGASGETISLNSFPGKGTIRAGGGSDVVIGTVNDDSLSGDAGTDDIDGGAGDDDLYGGDNGDTMNGEAGDDYLNGGNSLGVPGPQVPGDDEMAGGADSDTLNLQNSAAGSGADGGLGNDTFTVNQALNQSVTGGSGTGDSIELKGDLTLTNSSYGAGTIASVEKASTEEAVNVNASNFTGSLKVKAKIGAKANIVGSKGPNNITQQGGGGELRGGPAADTIHGTGSTVRGGGGADTLTGAFGSTTVIEDNVGSATLTDAKLDRANGADVTIKGFGKVVLNGTSGPDVIDASTRTSPVEIYGGAGADTLTGGAYADLLHAGTGVDTLKGLGSSDTFLARNGTATSIDCGDGNGDKGERDAIDTTAKCEMVLPPVVPPKQNPQDPQDPVDPPKTDPPKTDPPKTDPVPGLARLARLGTKVKKGKFKVSVRCEGQTPCSGVLMLRVLAGREPLVFNKRYTIAGGTTKTFRVKLGKSVRKRLKKAGRKGLKVRAVATTDAQLAPNVKVVRLRGR